jgi:hypothetical protein
VCSERAGTGASRKLQAQHCTYKTRTSKNIWESKKTGEKNRLALCSFYGTTPAKNVRYVFQSILPFLTGPAGVSSFQMIV